MFRILFLLLIIPTLAFGESDSLFLTESQLIWYVKNFHPVVVQSNLFVAEGQSSLKASRGEFDPVLQSEIDQKYFSDKSYYSLINAGLKVPTWYGIELKTGIDQSNGQYLNPQNELPVDGMWYAGISVPLGKGLFIDKRRATLSQAKIFTELSLEEQKRQLNDLFLQVVTDYWSWVEKYNQYLVYQEYAQLAEERLSGISQNFRQGEVPAIDTLEAFIQTQKRQLLVIDAKYDYQKASLTLSNHLWSENNIPLEISDQLKAPLLSALETLNSIPPFEESISKLVQNHPEIRIVDFELSILEVEKQLKVESLKPTINLNYNALASNAQTEVLSNYRIEDYKWGMEFSFPLFLRRERGELELTKLKIENTQLKQSQKLLSLQNKLKAAYIKHGNLTEQVGLVASMVNNYATLVSGEKKKLSIGESSLFLINQRENNLLEAKLKQNYFIHQKKVALRSVYHLSGELFNQFED